MAAHGSQFYHKETVHNETLKASLDKISACKIDRTFDVRYNQGRAIFGRHFLLTKSCLWTAMR